MEENENYKLIYTCGRLSNQKAQCFQTTLKQCCTNLYNFISTSFYNHVIKVIFQTHTRKNGGKIKIKTFIKKKIVIFFINKMAVTFFQKRFELYMINLIFCLTLKDVFGLISHM